MLYTDLRKGQSVKIGDAKITLIGASHKRNYVRIAIDADISIPVEYERKEKAHNQSQET